MNKFLIAGIIAGIGVVTFGILTPKDNLYSPVVESAVTARPAQTPRPTATPQTPRPAQTAKPPATPMTPRSAQTPKPPATPRTPQPPATAQGVAHE